MTGDVTLERATDGRVFVLVDGERVGAVDPLPGWAGRPVRWQPLTVSGMRLGRPCRTRRQGVIRVLLAYERREAGR